MKHLIILALLASIVGCNNGESRCAKNDSTEGAFVIVHKQGQVLMALRNSKSSCPNTWNFFGGRADKDETTKQSALREFYEETGLWLDENRLQYIMEVGGVKTYYSYEVAPDFTFTLDLKEQSDFDWFYPEEIHWLDVMPTAQRAIDEGVLTFLNDYESIW